MSCNGFNHQPGCTCGFRGGWGGYRSFDPLQRRFDNEPRPRQLGFQQGTAQPLSGGFTRPGAKCPVCGDTVYFYQSPYGGRVFFDDLGPPWPKHPCTDNITASSKAKAASHTSWHLNQWQPLTHASTAEISPVRGIYRISGRISDRDHSFFFRAYDIVMAEIVRIQKIGRGKFALSVLDFNTVDQTWCVWDGFAWTDSEAPGYGEPLIKTSSWKSFSPAAKAVQPKAHQQFSEDMHPCPHCGDLVRFKNLTRHIARVHLRTSAKYPTSWDLRK
ncbi:hypothetical protein JAO85_20825 [Comamonas sp. NyZ500]|uniref:hypothetical protein n=1 Tax=Comamonas sp. NyZ500 TaxID=2795732 RepID=UPI00192AD825|nr:hypothetical protein [Comamonas sp. NyZ500]MBL5979725.1 hypothetical protein [Comamonas sp. NyZ500]